MSKKVPVVKITASSLATGFAGLPFEATVAMADVDCPADPGRLGYAASGA